MDTLKCTNRRKPELQLKVYSLRQDTILDFLKNLKFLSHILHFKIELIEAEGGGLSNFRQTSKLFVESEFKSTVIQLKRLWLYVLGTVLSPGDTRLNKIDRRVCQGYIEGAYLSCDKLPQVEQLKITQIYDLIAPKVKSINEFHWDKIKVLAGLFVLEVQERIHLCFFQLLEASCIVWL